MLYPIFYNIFFSHSTWKKFKTRNEIIKDELINKWIVNNFDNSNAINYWGLTQLDNLNRESSTISWDIIYDNLAATWKHILKKNDKWNLEYIIPKHEISDLRKNSKLSLGVYKFIGILLFMFSFSIFVGQKNWLWLLGTLIASIIFGWIPIIVYIIVSNPLVRKNLFALNKYVIFEKERWIYYNWTYEGYKLMNDINNNSVVEFKNIRAVQVISIKNTLRRRKIEYYQINLILKDASRVNIYSTDSDECIISNTKNKDWIKNLEINSNKIDLFDISDIWPFVEKKMWKDAQTIWEFLWVPVWDMSNIKESWIA